METCKCTECACDNPPIQKSIKFIMFLNKLKIAFLKKLSK